MMHYSLSGRMVTDIMHRASNGWVPFRNRKRVKDRSHSGTRRNIDKVCYKNFLHHVSRLSSDQMSSLRFSRPSRWSLTSDCTAPASRYS